MTDDPALTLCERLSLQPRDRVGCARPSTRQPDRKCRAPECECGPSGDLLAIREHNRALIERCATRAAIHSQYPITTEYDRGYAAARKDAADAIRELKGASNDQA